MAIVEHLSKEEMDRLDVLDNERIQPEFILPILSMLKTEQLAESTFRSELQKIAEERNNQIDKHLFGEGDDYLLNFQYLPDDSAKPWNYYSIKQKMSKSDISFQENNSVDKYIQSTVAQNERL